MSVEVRPEMSASPLYSLDGPPAVLVTAVSKQFGGADAVRQVSLATDAGQFVSILGPSGCGKTTLLRLIGGFERQDSGSVRVHGRCVDDLPPNKRDVNTVFQRYALFPHKNVRENILFPLEVGGVPKSEREQRVREMIDLVHLEGFESRDVTKLSGGQAQRVALARALAARPSVLLLDEPLAALDLKLRKELQLELRRVQEELGTTFLYVTHDQEEALTMSDRIVVMNEGEVVQEGIPKDIYERPASVFVSRFIGEANLLRGTVASADSHVTQVAVQGETISAPSSEMSAGEAVVVSVRPEAVRIEIGANEAGDRNGFVGAVKRVVFLGGTVRCFVELPEGGTLIVQALPKEVVGLESGQQVSVGWEIDDSVLLPED